MLDHERDIAELQGRVDVRRSLVGAELVERGVTGRKLRPGSEDPTLHATRELLLEAGLCGIDVRLGRLVRVSPRDHHRHDDQQNAADEHHGEDPARSRS